MAICEQPSTNFSNHILVFIWENTTISTLHLRDFDDSHSTRNPNLMPVCLWNDSGHSDWFGHEHVNQSEIIWHKYISHICDIYISHNITQTYFYWDLWKSLWLLWAKLRGYEDSIAASILYCLEPRVNHNDIIWVNIPKTSHPPNLHQHFGFFS